MIDDINLWYAKDKNNNIVKIININENNRKEEYYCPICMSSVIPKLGTKTKHHFAHIDASKCTNESFIHFWIKNKLLSVGDSFKIKTDDDILSYKCINIEMEKEYKTQYGIYKPDITVTTDTNEIIFFEIAYTNKKRIDEYYKRWNELNNIVVEINAKHLINGSESKEFKCVYYNGDICNFVFKEYKNTASFKLYKDNLFKENDIKEAEERLKKIDWFWQECYKRRFNKISDEDFFDIIDYLDIDDRLYVIDKVLKTTYIHVCSLYDIEEYLAYKDKSVSLLNDINGNRIGVYIKRYKEDEFSLYLKPDDYWSMHKWFICAVKGNEIRTSGKSYLYYTVEEFEKISNKIISDKIRELRYN